MSHSTTDLTKLLEPYKTGWVALNKAETKVLAHADTFAAINDKIKDRNPDELDSISAGPSKPRHIYG